MNITMTTHDLRMLISEVTAKAVNDTLVEVGLVKSSLNKAEAYKKYGRCNVDRWIKEGLLKGHKDGVKAALRYDKKLLETISRSNNVASYLQVNNR